MSGGRIPAGVRLQRLLSVLQWVASHEDGVEIDAVCQRFDLRQDELVKELEMATMIGGDSRHYDEMPFVAYIEGQRVNAMLLSFKRPLRLTPAEGLALLASADALLGEDHDPDAPLARALVKLGDLLGIKPEETVEVDLDPDGGQTGRELADAIQRRRRVRFTYWSYGRDEVTQRLVEPWQTRADVGSWYLSGFDVDRGEVRTFRLDRIDALVVTDEPAVVEPDATPAQVSFPENSPLVVLDLSDSARWVVDTYPVVDLEPRPQGGLRVTMAVMGSPWLERLLLRLGPAATIVDIDPRLGSQHLTASAARRVLARYEASSGPR